MKGNDRRKVCVVLVDRANYGRLKPVMQTILLRPELELQIVAAAAMVQERCGLPVGIVQRDGFRIDAEVHTDVEGSAPVSMAKSVGLATFAFADEFQRLQPDVVLVIGDRCEALAATIAAAYMNLCVAHVQGGEVSGSIDESARHAITKLSHFHFPSTQRAAEYLIRMGERPDTILAVGCPGSDIAFSRDRRLPLDALNTTGSGVLIDGDKPFLLAIFHPVTTTYGAERAQTEQLLEALNDLAIQTVLLWPNNDAGADRIRDTVHEFCRKRSPQWLRTMVNLAPEEYLNVLANAACAVGNSSSFVRDAGYFGTPVTLVGDRQDGREADVHVIRVPPAAAGIVKAVRAQIQHGPYDPCTLYGIGDVAHRITNALVQLQPYRQKKLAY